MARPRRNTQTHQDRAAEPLKDRLEEVQRRTGLKQERIAKLTGISQSVISRILKTPDQPVHPDTRQQLEAFLSVGPPVPLDRMETFAALAVSLLPGSGTTDHHADLAGCEARRFLDLLTTVATKLRATDSVGVADAVQVINIVRDELRKRRSDLLDVGALEEVAREYLEAQSKPLHRRLDKRSKARWERKDMLFELAKAALPTTQHGAERAAVRAEWSERFSWWSFCQNDVVTRVRRDERRRFVRFVEHVVRDLQRRDRKGRPEVHPDRHAKGTAVECIRRIESIAATLLGNADAEDEELRRLRQFINDLRTRKPADATRKAKGQS